MHPADEFVAFAKMTEQGASIEDVATAFGVTRKVVAKRMTLGRVAPRQLDRARKKLEKAQAGWEWIRTALERHEATEGLVQLYGEQRRPPNTGYRLEVVGYADHGMGSALLQ